MFNFVEQIKAEIKWWFATANRPTAYLTYIKLQKHT